MLKLNEAIREYELRREEGLKEAEKLRKKYDKWLGKKKKELLKAVEKLEKARPPKKVDEKLLQIVETDRRNYVNAIRHALEGIQTIDDLGKRLQDLAKVHFDYGKHVIILFEKEVYAINSLLKELTEGYAKFRSELEESIPPKIDVVAKLEELRETHREFLEKREAISRLARKLEELRSNLEYVVSSEEFVETNREIQDISKEIRSVELELRSKVSKLQKPLKRMRLGGIADEVARDSGVALERPNEFLSLLKAVYPKLDGKAQKSARWLMENFEERLSEMSALRSKLEELSKRREEILGDTAQVQAEFQAIERELSILAEDVKKLEKKLLRLENELKAELEKLEAYLGERIELTSSPP
ncbi:coiled-coil domain-containing protein [Thermococcus eurythermalis]|uniref:YbaB/EbfC family nucleoid-associated protein n=1 Tax=Thermococcus eurythermalis TaxID=1505907 RepID=UPI000679B14C|nr:YbaB/EbfC family nucleoid-associated protein [Thermococcus eurythermalis]